VFRNNPGDLAFLGVERWLLAKRAAGSAIKDLVNRPEELFGCERLSEERKALAQSMRIRERLTWITRN
jgi:hypothetical protein